MKSQRLTVNKKTLTTSQMHGGVKLSNANYDRQQVVRPVARQDLVWRDAVQRGCGLAQLSAHRVGIQAQRIVGDGGQHRAHARGGREGRLVGVELDGPANLLAGSVAPHTPNICADQLERARGLLVQGHDPVVDIARQQFSLLDDNCVCAASRRVDCT